ILRALSEDSPLIAESVKQYPENHFETGETAAAWMARRVKYQRLNNRKLLYNQIMLPFFAHAGTYNGCNGFRYQYYSVNFVQCRPALTGDPQEVLCSSDPRNLENRYLSPYMEYTPRHRMQFHSG
ncbi:hypothetical protein BU15DRAFT_69338, partial [Melanogaster broomeanus]